MKRRSFLRKSAIAASAGGLVVGCTSENNTGGEAAAVITNRQIRWRLISSFPRSLDTIYGAAEVFAQRVHAMTDGKFDIRVYPAGEIVPYDQVLESVQKGTVQMGHTASYYFKGKNPALPFDCTVPFGLTSRQQVAWLMHAGGMELMRELFADFNIINFLGGNTGIQMGGWFRKEINSLSDLRGLKMRIPGLGGEVMDRMGVGVEQIAGGEVYPALERGAIDAAEWVGPYDDLKLGFHRVAQFYYYPGWWEPGPGLSFYVNQDEWDKLPLVYQEAVKTASVAASTSMQSSYDAKNPGAFAELLDEGVQLRPFPDELMAEAEKHAFDIMEEEAAADAGYQKVYSSFKKFRDESYRWFSTAENTYGAFAFNRNQG
ncbi:MAG: TRAP transporter substrate-binding protein [Rhodothermaceae bacterium]|nr:TRAP transporter substrate-binding protein [Rhodothermaceae bacterium]